MLHQKFVFNSRLLKELQLYQAKERKYFIYVTEKMQQEFQWCDAATASVYV